MTVHQVFDLENFVLESGLTCPDARVLYKTYGALAPDKSNVIVYPIAFGGRHRDMEWFVVEGPPLDLTEYFARIINTLGKGLLSSPSNAIAPFDWRALFPVQVARICCICGAARAAPYNRLVLQGLRAELTADEIWRDAWFESPPSRGVLAMAWVYASWALSQAFCREETGWQTGYPSLEDSVIYRWVGFMRRQDSNDIETMLCSWERANISANEIHQGAFDAALGAMRAEYLVMPSKSDRCFRVEENSCEVARIPNVELRPTRSVWGHMSGSYSERMADSHFIDGAVHELLAGEVP